MDYAHVRRGLTRVHAMVHGLRLADTHAPYHTMPLRPAHIVHPLAGSCANCEMAANDGACLKLKRCSRCHMTRYCGRACQKRDWAQHRVVCGMVHEIVFENWHLVRYYATLVSSSGSCACAY
ncbi:hypothetical protein TRAPUB_1470 [Trametes pubescens]|uniref:MYND-type domain-containing protein n=1 Tax=Trametes pubescens TaxID=154538 RepID=A0A1M2VJ93_TRAPU|nr:hypothetical protein TRAPUB_1470 [Trametes pubescens]